MEDLGGVPPPPATAATAALCYSSLMTNQSFVTSSIALMLRLASYKCQSAYQKLENLARRSSVELMPLSQITVLRQTMSMATAALIAAKPDQGALDLPAFP